jgi:ADP-ribose pyrophosphatase YjhB (NUDIX family)
VCDRCDWRWYANPKPAAGTVIERLNAAGEPEVLLLRRAVQPGLGAWDLPAGYLEPDESVEEAACRETAEEAGFEVQLVELIGIYTSRPGNAVSAVFLARPVEAGASVDPDDESSDHAWVARADVPSWLPRMAFRSMAIALADWAEGRRGIPRDW